MVWRSGSWKRRPPFCVLRSLALKRGAGRKSVMETMVVLVWVPLLLVVLQLVVLGLPEAQLWGGRPKR